MLEAGTIVSYAPRKRGVVIEAPAAHQGQVLVVGQHNDHEFPVDTINLQLRGTYDTVITDPDLCGGYGETGCRYLGMIAASKKSGIECRRFSAARENINNLSPTNLKRRPSRLFPLCR